MRKKRVKAAFLCVIIFYGVLCILNGFAFPSFDTCLIPAEYIPGFILDDTITLQNTLDRPISFFYKPLSEDITPSKKILNPGEIAIFSNRDHIEIRLPAESTGLFFWLSPGERYVIKDLGKDDIRLFKLIQGSSYVVNLAPYVPTPASAIDIALELIGVNSDSVLYDLGCGDGCVVIRAAAKFGAGGVGVDIDAGLVDLARKTAAAAGVSERVTFLNQDIFETDLSEASIVYLYLSSDSLKLLRPFLETNLEKGITVASFGFAFPGWEDKLVEEAYKDKTIKVIPLWEWLLK